MYAGGPITFICCIVALSIHPNRATEQTELYTSVLQENERMVKKVRFGYMLTQRCQDDCEGNRRTMLQKLAVCRCDKHCAEYGDCCIDYWRSCNSSFSDAYKRRRPIAECLDSTLRLANTSKSETNVKVGFTVVTKCPFHYQQNLGLKKACENPRNNDAESIPFVDGKDGRIYRNQHCAECHGITEWKRWNTSLSCPKYTLALIRRRLAANNYTFSTDERRMIRETCKVTMKPDGKTRNLCTRSIECKNKTHPDYRICRSYMQLLYPSGTSSDLPIKNPHCARCSNIDLRMLQGINFRGGTEGGGSSSLAILFDFTKASNIYGRKKTIAEIRKCEQGSVYDFKLKACRSKRIVNLRNTTLGNWTCEFGNETFPNTSVHIAVFRNRSIFVYAHNRLYEPDWYRWHGANVTVCGNLTTRFLTSTKAERAVLYSELEFYITLVGYSLSILALVAVIVTYLLFIELRTLPGKIIINLAVALLLSQLIFLVDIVNDVSGDFCTAIAVVLHYLYISAFCWMNALSFDVSRTFAGQSHRSPSGARRKVFLFCLLYGWGLPLVICGITLAVSYSGALDAGYGNDYYCWITNPIALAIFFAAPVVAMLLFNIVALIRVMMAVRRVRKISQKVRDKSTTGEDIGMCWKLTAVFGVTWILGLAAGYHIVLRIVFIVCNSLQGVFIMVGFILTRRVLNMYLKKAGKKPLTTQASSQKSTATTNTTTSRMQSNVPLVESKPMKKQRQPSVADEVAIDEETPETRLIASVEGPETKL